MEGTFTWIKNYDRNWLFWKWNETTSEIEREKVPQWLYNFRLAEEACYDALDIDLSERLTPP